MSTPGIEFRESEYLGLSFLAVSSSELLDRLLDGQPIDDDERHTLLRAKKFLEDASSGAQLVKSGMISNVNAVETVRKLTYSVEPLKLMQEQIQATEAGEAFDKMATTIGSAVESKLLDQENLRIAKDFFQQLHIAFIKLSEKQKRRTGSVLNFGLPVMAYVMARAH